ncbi:peptidoglycan editing factor PgeF [Croceibacterium aestuarii]|uniref:peptidoglycan editing factor PgeF n=1 Tax=Croceibacterium aestuarii TaxID=3064139 RepID=UPI00272E9CE2|nr:peptidoglycan editing factor PgeF [Croceibacterium sp. D39]
MVDEPVEVIRSAALAGIPHGFLGRRGGVSEGLVAGLDMGSRGMEPGDPRMAPIAENRRRGVEAVLPEARLVTVYQIHSPDCVIAAEWDEAERPRADALVTDRPGLLLGVLTADCAPVLLADRSAGVVGAAHAGWRGAWGGVLEAVVEAMEALGAHREDIAAAIGPAIALESYEVDDPFRERFTQSDGRFFAPGRAGHWYFDLEGYAEARLEAMGVGAIDALGLDTYSDEERFFSYRRATHRGEADYGRQISLIGLPL